MLVNMCFRVHPSLSFVLSLVLLLTVFSCQTDQPLIPESIVEENSPYPGVDEALWSYFSAFEAEAKERGKSIDLAAEGITAVLDGIDEEHVAGVCQYNFRSENHIIIDSEFWENASTLFREMIIFHELGHCSLGQDHREDVVQGNLCASIMRSGSEGCRDAYNSQNRDYYLDELFAFEGEGL